MSIYNTPPLLASLFLLFLGGLAIGMKPKGKENRAWALLTLFLAIWSFGTFTLYISQSKEAALSWLKLYNLGVIFIPAAFVHFVFTISDDESSFAKWTIGVTYLLSSSFYLLSTTRLFNETVAQHPWGYYPVPGRLNILFDAFFISVLILGFIKLVLAYRRSSGWKRNQYTYFFAAVAVSFVGAITNFLPLYGGSQYPIGHIAILIAAILITVAIVKFRLLDINVIIRKSAVYSVLTAIVTAIYVGIVFILQSVFRGLTGSNSIIAVMIVALIVAMTFEPVRRSVQLIIDRLFFRQKYEYQQVVQRVSDGLHSEVSPSRISSIVIDAVIDSLQVKTGWLMTYDRSSEKYLVVASRGMSIADQAVLRIGKDSRIVEHLMDTRTPIWLNDPEMGVLRRRVDKELRDQLSNLGANLLCPLHGKSALIGMMFIGAKKSGEVVNHNDTELVATLCNQAAISIEHTRLYDDLQASYLNTIKSLVAALEAKDVYTKGHSERVALYAREIAAELGLSGKECQLLYEISLLHDVGKIGVSEQILNKKTKLSKAEMEHVQSHTITGEKILSTVESMRDGLSAVRHHHERLNGDGYPDGLSEVNIPLTARILAVADAYDAMTTERPYRQAMTAGEAINELKSHAGQQFDPKVVRAFIAVVLGRKTNTKTHLRGISSTKRHKSLKTA